MILIKEMCYMLPTRIKTRYDYYKLSKPSKQMLVDWFVLTADLIQELRVADNCDDLDSLKMLRSVITQKNLKHLNATFAN